MKRTESKEKKLNITGKRKKERTYRAIEKA